MTGNLLSDPAAQDARAHIATMPLDGIDPADPQWFVDDTIGDIFARLRREDPVHRSCSPIEGIGHYWSVTRYRDIMHVETHHELFSSDWTRGGITLMDFPPGEERLQMFIAMDPPKHDEERKVVSPIASPGNRAPGKPDPRAHLPRAGQPAAQ